MCLLNFVHVRSGEFPEDMSMEPANNLGGEYNTSAAARHPAFRAPRLYIRLPPSITGLPISGLFKRRLREYLEV